MSRLCGTKWTGRAPRATLVSTMPKLKQPVFMPSRSWTVWMSWAEFSLSISTNLRQCFIHDQLACHPSLNHPPKCQLNHFHISLCHYHHHHHNQVKRNKFPHSSTTPTHKQTPTHSKILHLLTLRRMSLSSPSTIHPLTPSRSRLLEPMANSHLKPTISSPHSARLVRVHPANRPRTLAKTH